MSALSAVLDETYLDTGERGPLRGLSMKALLVTWAHLMRGEFNHHEVLLARVEWEAKQRRVRLRIAQGAMGGLEARLEDNLTSSTLVFLVPSAVDAEQANNLNRAAYYMQRTRERL